MFSVALSVGMPSGITSRVYPLTGFLGLRKHGLRGIAPFGVRTFLPRLSPEAIPRLSEIDVNIASWRPRSKYSLHP